jgi:diazepam-binding inhibitor (GABA receptor modulating acyl-CoA-binding protein)
MDDALEQAFRKAAVDVTTLDEAPGTLTKLRLYALFKQAQSGDASGERPGATDFIARAKWDAWQSIAGMNGDDAKRAYVELVASLG